jgi:energy-coupling factor transporter ATP-binding protein EcfA2
MRIASISVSKLFGIFDHEIPLNLDERVTIIHGPNGFGKTVILRLLDAVFNRRYSALRQVPFHEFSVKFDDGSRLWVEKETVADERQAQNGRTDLRVHLLANGEEVPVYVPTPLDTAEATIALRYLEHDIGGLERVGPQTWRLYTGEDLDVSELLERFSDRIPAFAGKLGPEPDWLRDIRAQVPIRFIETQRLLAPTPTPAPRALRDLDRRRSPNWAVAAHSEALATAIQGKLNEYGQLTQTLDRTFFARVVNQSPDEYLSADALVRALGTLEAKGRYLVQAGLLEPSANADISVPTQIDEAKRGPLSLYATDVDQKLQVFDELAARLDLMKRIINSRFNYKSMSIDQKKGFSFRSDSGQPIAPTLLSSGEQHELILMYELLFQVRPESVVLIDEPEISLHVEWQEAFLRDLIEIVQLSKFDVIVATHSPTIISDRWDLTVQLRGPDKIDASTAVPVTDSVELT